MNAKLPSIPLPERAKSTLVYAVALAHHGLVSIRSWCANSPIERVRLADDNERLQAEVELLREELRIKDARMARVAPAKRPHYAPADRLAILQLQAARGWSMAQLACVFLPSAATITVASSSFDACDGSRWPSTSTVAASHIASSVGRSASAASTSAGSAGADC
jgi:hypothetical protein